MWGLEKGKTMLDILWKKHIQNLKHHYSNYADTLLTIVTLFCFPISSSY
jgi:hypothetical protein